MLLVDFHYNYHKQTMVISYSLFPIPYFLLYVYYLISPVAKIRLEAYTERSESNPGHGLGIYDTNKDGCLEDSTLH